jgi:hypothetical protein
VLTTPTGYTNVTLHVLPAPHGLHKCHASRAYHPPPHMLHKRHATRANHTSHTKPHVLQKRHASRANHAPRVTQVSRNTRLPHPTCYTSVTLHALTTHHMPHSTCHTPRVTQVSRNTVHALTTPHMLHQCHATLVKHAPRVSDTNHVAHVGELF